MRSYRNMLVPSRQLLARQLDHLRSTLDALGSRLRDAVSQAVGETVGVVMRDVVNNTLDRIAGFIPDPEPPRERHRSWEDEDDDDPWADDAWDEPQRYQKTPPVPEKRNPQKVVTSVSAGLHVAAWWMRRWTGRLGIVSTAVVGVIASCGAYAVPALFTAGIRMIGSAGQLAFLSDAVQSLSST